MIEKPQEEIKVIDQLTWVIPQCCRELWPSCKHVVQKQKKKKVNIGL